MFCRKISMLTKNPPKFNATYLETFIVQLFSYTKESRTEWLLKEILQNSLSKFTMPLTQYGIPLYHHTRHCCWVNNSMSIFTNVTESFFHIVLFYAFIVTLAPYLIHFLRVSTIKQSHKQLNPWCHFFICLMRIVIVSVIGV